MAIGAPLELLFVTNEGSVAKSGYSTTLAKGQFGITDKGLPNTSLGQVVTTTFPTNPKNREFELKLGSANLAVNRFQSNKAWSSVPFRLEDIVDISVTAPSLDKSVDKFIIGYDGINPNSAIVLSNGDNETITITLSGSGIGMLGYKDSCVELKLHLTAPLGEETFTMQEIIEKAVENFKDIKLLGGIPVTEYLKISTVNSENPTSILGKEYTFFTLKVKDEGRKSDLAKVQAQYPLLDVKLQKWESGYSTYVVLVEKGTVLADYTATETSLADADCDGVPEVTTSTADTSWVEGDTCNAVQKNFKLQLADNKCGGDRLADLQAFYPELTILIDTPNQKQDITLTGTSGTVNLNIAGINYLATFNTDLETTASDFVTSHAATLLALGYTVTSLGDVISVLAVTKDFPIITFANVSGDLGATIGSITGVGTAVTNVACQTVYNTKVFTEIVCEECSPIFRDLFTAQAPKQFEMVTWTEEAPVYSETALMGIVVEGKYTIFAGNEEYRNSVPNIHSSTKISIGNESPGFVNESFKAGTNGRFEVKVMSIASDPEGLGMYLRPLEEYSRTYFSGAPAHHDNNYARYVLGEESLLKPLVPYILYSVTVSPSKYANSMSQLYNQNFRYIVAVEVGRQADTEDVFNALATAAGFPTISAY